LFKVNLFIEDKNEAIDYLFRVIKTRNGQFPLGGLVLAYSGWQTHYLSKDGKDLRPIPFDLDSLSPSVSLGVLGMPG
jgi:NADPH-dependent curcumin reductase CurA